VVVFGEPVCFSRCWLALLDLLVELWVIVLPAEKLL
jgi:hypothetical protein